MLQLSPINLNKDYCAKWNERSMDFVCLTKDGELIRDTLYRLGGIGSNNLNIGYSLLLKYVEAFYPKDITSITKNDPKHLKGLWCILDKDGNEKVVFKPFQSPYIINDSLIYSVDKKYVNIETGKLYCEAYTRIDSKEFLFLENKFDKDESKRGVLKINKKDGSYELFK